MEQAIDLARRSFKQTPFELREAMRLANLQALVTSSRPQGHGPEEALELLVADLLASSEQLSFLHSKHPSNVKVDIPLQLTAAYWRRKVQRRTGARPELTVSGELRLFGCALDCELPSLPTDSSETSTSIDHEGQTQNNDNVTFDNCVEVLHADCPIGSSASVDWSRHAEQVLFISEHFPNTQITHTLTGTFSSDVEGVFAHSDPLSSLLNPTHWPQSWPAAYWRIRGSSTSPTSIRERTRAAQLALSRFSALALAREGVTKGKKLSLACVLWLVALNPDAFP